jgi:pyruvate/2-oxoglutarate dehydrogenase complex dihydrolipoamide acyltransferase (E2) component
MTISTILVPRINTNDNKVQVIAWHIAADDYVEIGQDIVDLETSKAAVSVSAELAGYIYPLVKKGTVIRVGDPLYSCASTREEFAIAVSDTDLKTIAAPSLLLSSPEKLAISMQGHFSATRFSKTASRIIQEQGLTLGDFKGSGLVTSRSLEATDTGVKKDNAKSMNYSKNEQSTPKPVTPRSESISLAKQAEISSLSIGESGNINSMLSVHFDSAPIRLRLINEGAFDGNIQPLILFEISRLLKQWPQFTAYFEDNNIYYFDRIDLGVAIDLGKGLKVVTIKEADQLMPIEFFEKTIEIGIRYVENRIQPDELAGSTLTITDLSGLDILHFHPLINGNQSAIIGIGGDSTKLDYPMSVNMTFDHRVTNGREVATFLKELRSRLLSYASTDDITEEDEVIQDSYLQIQAELSNTDEIFCDTCGIDHTTYQQNFGREAYMLAYYKTNGTLGSVCHRCFGRWI